MFVRLPNFPGGPAAFEQLTRHCYGENPPLTVANIAYLFYGARQLRLAAVTRATEQFMVDVVLTSASHAASVLADATPIKDQPDAVMIELVGRCINTVAAQFDVVPELQLLPADCFACVLRTAKDMRCPKRLLESAAIAFIESRVDPSPAPSTITPAEFHEVVAAPGAMDDMMHADAVYRQLEVLLGELSDADAADLCTKLSEVALWRCLPHAAIEAAYANRTVPDRCVSMALMSENRHLLKLNDELADQLEDVCSTLQAHGMPLPPSVASGGVVSAAAHGEMNGTGTAGGPSAGAGAGAGAASRWPALKDS